MASPFRIFRKHQKVLIATLGLLFKEAESYQEYVQTGEEREATLYDNYRNNAWAKITDLLGIEDQVEE